MKLISSLNAWRANVADPPRSRSIAPPSTYESEVSANINPATRKISGVSPRPRSATTPTEKSTENPTAADADEYRNGTPSHFLALIAPTPSSAHRQVQPSGAEGDEQQAEEEANRERPATSRQGEHQHQQPEPDDDHRERADGELIALVRRGTPRLVHAPIKRVAPNQRPADPVSREDPR